VGEQDGVGPLRLQPITTVADFGSMDVPSCQVPPGALTEVVVLDSLGAIGSGRPGRLFLTSSLNAGPFIRGENEVLRAQGSAFPNALTEIENQTGLGRKMRIARKNPAAMLPGDEGHRYWASVIAWRR